MAIGISPALPVVYDQVDGPYRLNKSLKRAIIQNFKNLVLTNPGERVMDPRFGVGIRQYLFELETPSVRFEIKERIYKQVDLYMSDTIEVQGVEFSEGSYYEGDTISTSNTNAIYVNILFRIIPLDTVSVLSLPAS